MSSSENEDNAKRIYQQLEPLCLFFCPYDTANYDIEEESYVSENVGKKVAKEESEKFENRKRKVRRGKQEMWLRRRRELGIKRKRMPETSRYLKNYLLTSGAVKPNGGDEKVYVPYLIEGLETVKDAWLPNERFHERCLDENETFDSRVFHKHDLTMIEDKAFVLPLSNRRSSMPEEYMRRYFLRKMVPSEESETNQTVPDVSSVSSKDLECESSREIPESIPAKKEPQIYNRTKNLHKINVMKEFDETVQFYGKNRDGGMKRVTQNQYDNQGKGIIKLKTKERGSQTGRFSERSETSATAKEDTDVTRTSESLTSSSPVELPRPDISTSGNLSSESEEVQCTCAELSSKETSTDLFPSGNSTLSQTVSEKSLSTQDSTISIHSVSTGGSTLSTNSNSSSPEIFTRTSAKETSSPEHTHREKIKRNPPFKSFHRIFRRGYPKFMRKRPYCRRHFRRRRICYEITEEKETRDDCSDEENCEGENIFPPSRRETSDELKVVDQAREKREEQNVGEIAKYEWVKYTPEEIYMMQQMRHKKFIENYRRFSVPLPATPDTRSLGVCAAKGSVYKPSEDLDDRILIPRYSALPRSLSMIVNTSSGDTSAINSDSDSLSLADSLEEFPVAHVHKISYDTKKELKPVRGDVNAAFEGKKKVKRREPRAKAFFVSIKEPYGEDELLSGITKIPEPPQKIKERINERQLNILHLRKKNLERKMDENKKRGRSDARRKNARAREKRYRSKKEDFSSENPDGKGDMGYRNFVKDEDRKIDQELKTLNAQAHSAFVTRNKNKAQNHKKSTICKERGTRGNVSSDLSRFGHEIHSSKAVDIGKQLLKNSEINETVTVNSSLSKPQAVIHPSLMPTSEPELLRKTTLLDQSRPYRYRQKFEVIPEEKSSSMSSTDENTTGETKRKTLLPMKKTDTFALPENQKKYTVGNVSNLVFAKFMEKSLRACMQKGSTSERPIILLSPKAAEAGANSRKGRDALIALNREDFNRLSKGWMNFYLLKETSDASENSVQEEKEDCKVKDENLGHNTKEESLEAKQESGTFGEEQTSHFLITEKQKNHDLTSVNTNREWRGSFKEGEQESTRKKVLNDSVRLHSSNTVLKPINIIPRKVEKRLSLPELNVSSPITTATHQQSPTPNQALVLPKVPHKNLEYDGMDSDSTVYCQPPSSIVPRLIFYDSANSEGSLSNSESDELTTLPVKYIPLRNRGTSRRARPKREALRREAKDHSGWSVTVAGTLELSAAAPDLEMRLSFPANGCGPPQAIHSDSGFVEDGFRSKGAPLGESVTSEGNRKQRWTVTVQNPKQGYNDGTERKAGRNHILPDLGQTQSRNVKKVLKERPKTPDPNKKPSPSENFSFPHGIHNALTVAHGFLYIVCIPSRTLTNEEEDGKVSIFWPKVGVRRDDWLEEVVNEEELSVRGNAVPMEKKPRPPTMSERDLTRGFTARSNHSDSKYSKKYFDA